MTLILVTAAGGPPQTRDAPAMSPDGSVTQAPTSPPTGWSTTGGVDDRFTGPGPESPGQQPPPAGTPQPTDPPSTTTSSTSTATAVPAGSEDASGVPGQPLILLLVGVAVVVIALAVLLFTLRRRRTPDDPAAEAPAAPGFVPPSPPADPAPGGFQPVEPVPGGWGAPAAEAPFGTPVPGGFGAVPPPIVHPTAIPPAPGPGDQHLQRLIHEFNMAPDPAVQAQLEAQLASAQVLRMRVQPGDLLNPSLHNVVGVAAIPESWAPGETDVSDDPVAEPAPEPEPSGGPAGRPAADDPEESFVIEVVRPGWIRDGAVLRAADVVVSR